MRKAVELGGEDAEVIASRELVLERLRALEGGFGGRGGGGGEGKAEAAEENEEEVSFSFVSSLLIFIEASPRCIQEYGLPQRLLRSFLKRENL